jgi:hypothetical protein
MLNKFIDFLLNLFIENEQKNIFNKNEQKNTFGRCKSRDLCDELGNSGWQECLTCSFYEGKYSKDEWEKGK